MYHDLKLVAKTQGVNPGALEAFKIFAVNNWRKFGIVTEDDGILRVSTGNSERLVAAFNAVDSHK
jgi:hypothetical protein